MRYDDWVTQRFFEELMKSKLLADADSNSQLSSQLAQRLKRAVVVTPDEVMTQRVQFAAFVTVYLTHEGEEQTFQIVSDDEADLAAGRLGATSPLAQALFGSQEGDCVTVEFDAGATCEYEVTHIAQTASTPWG
jgi:transcription elongation GreA/GreB family factor